MANTKLEVKCIFCPARNVYTDDCLRRFVFEEYANERAFGKCVLSVRGCRIESTEKNRTFEELNFLQEHYPNGVDDSLRGEALAASLAKLEEE